jgi:hypothetical protein
MNLDKNNKQKGVFFLFLNLESNGSHLRRCLGYPNNEN